MRSEIDTIKFSELMMGLAENFKETLSKNQIKLWYELFQEDGYTLDQIRAGAHQVVRTREYKGLPTYAEFATAIMGKQPSIESRAVVEADRIIAHLRSKGSGVYPEPSDPITEYLMTRRWPYRQWAMDVLTSEIQWWKKEFVESYKAHGESKTPLSIGNDSPIRGLIENIGERI